MAVNLLTRTTPPLGGSFTLSSASGKEGLEDYFLPSFLLAKERVDQRGVVGASKLYERY
jgi:hypothetical protein